MEIEIEIKTASKKDAPKILSLQKLAYRSEAELINDFTIPPLVQTEAEILSEFEDHLVLKAVAGGRIIGSVRAFQTKDTCFVGKLIVHPDLQNQGVGSRLLLAAESSFPNVQRYELFTGQKSLRNLYLYKKYGYSVFREKKVSDNLTLVFLEKLRSG